MTVDLITSRAPSAVIRAAHQAQVLRDKRLSRVLAAGIERRGSERVFYVVTERPRGVRLDELLGKVAFTPASAAATMGEAAGRVGGVADTDMHHGLMRAESITITDQGRVMVSGLGIDGVIAGQSGRARARNERADAVALASLYLAAITAMDPAEVTEHDVPADVPHGCARPVSCADQGLRSQDPCRRDARARLWRSRVLKMLVAEAPSLWWPRSPVAPARSPVDEVEEAAGFDGEAVGESSAGPLTRAGGRGRCVGGRGRRARRGRSTARPTSSTPSSSTPTLSPQRPQTPMSSTAT